ncbi:MAG: Na/Pi cotransporter family protein [Rhizobiaceae bacterium]
MTMLMILLHLAGATMLLLYSVRMVRTGVERASGPALRRAISGVERGRVLTAAVGTLIAVLLQSSTATAVLASGFAVSGLVALTTGLALMLGADIGTALVVQVLSFDLRWLVPVLLAAGGWIFLNSSARAMKQGGRIMLGIAFVLIALTMISEATAPLKESPFMPVLASYLSADYVTAFLAGLAFTFLIHSSVAAVLMIAAFTGQGVLPIEASLSLLLGANAGGALIAVWLTRGMPVAGRRLPAGNLVFRFAGAVAALMIVRFVGLPLEQIGPNPMRQVINVHLLFNVVLAIICLPLVGPAARLVQTVMAEEAEPDAAARLRPASALDRNVLSNPGQALASATREVLRMAEMVEVMTRPVMELFENGNQQEAARVRALDEEVNEAHTAIKLYLAEVNRGKLSAEEAERSMGLTSLAIDLERAGDVVTKKLIPLALEKNKKKIAFSGDGWKELTDVHDRVMTNMQLAMNVLVSDDVDSARQLIAEKDRMRGLERASHDRHLERLTGGSAESVASSDIHLDTVRALKEINTLFASVAVPILSRSGQLLESRLVAAK